MRRTAGARNARSSSSPHPRFLPRHRPVARFPSPNSGNKEGRQRVNRLTGARHRGGPMLWRRSRRKRARRRLYGAGGVAGLGMLLGWLTAPKKGDEVRQALKERGSAASQKVAELRGGAADTSGSEPGSGLSGSAA